MHTTNHRPIFYLAGLPCVLAASLSAGCGFSEQINSSVSEQEKKLQSQACQQVLQQTDVFVTRVKDVVPTADAAIPLPGSQCTLKYTETNDQKAIRVESTPCPITIPSDVGQEFKPKMSLAELSLAATRTSPGIWALTGTGRLDVSAELPVFGTYQGVAGYRLDRSSVDTVRKAIEMHLVVTYASGQNTLELRVDVSGTQQALTGSITGPNLQCEVSGSLSKPSLKCK